VDCTRPGDDDLVAPQGLLPDDDDDDDVEDDVREADADEPAATVANAAEPPAPPRQDEARAAAQASEPASATPAADASSPPVTAENRPGPLVPSVLLAAALAVQLAIAIWVKAADHAAGFAPVFGYAAMLVLGIGALFLLGRGAGDKIGLRPFTSFQFLLLLFAAAPASILAAQTGNLIAHLCDTQSFPAWLRPPRPGEFQQLALAIAGLCIVPALAQELVFRGVVGRALTAKFGVFIGMLLTCLAFAAAYVFPQWIASAFVLAVVIQIVFVATRSLAAAIVLNALCAGVALLVQRYPDVLSIPGFTHPQVRALIAWEVLVASGTVLLTILAALYLTRTRYLTVEGKPWTPGYASLERPPRDAQTQLHSPDAHGMLVILVVAVFACFIILLFREGKRGAAEVEAYNHSKVRIPQPPPPSRPGNNGMPQPFPGMGGPGPGGVGPGGPGAKGGGPGGGRKGKKAKAPFGKGPPEGPLAEVGAKGNDPAGSKERSVDHMRFVFLEDVGQSDGKPQATVRARSLGTDHKLRIDDEAEIGGVKFKVLKIDEEGRTIEIQLPDGTRRSAEVGKSLGGGP
jgi:membrane protease YdiL (CAAX protease family)